MKVVEPQIVFTKAIIEAKADANQLVTVVLTAQNTGTSNAYEVVVEDVLNPAEFDLSSITFGTDPTCFTHTFDTTTGKLSYKGVEIDVGATVTLDA